jgi:REP element-mobilizing transposase RayT
MNKFPQRKRNRLENYDYTLDGYYFITICTKNKIEYFGNVEHNKMILNEYGKSIEENLLKIKERFNVCEIDYYVVMPNHIHFILILDNSRSKSNKSITEVIGSFKSITTIELHKMGLKDFRWQRSYYDRIIRNEKELYLIRRYIEQNPLRWDLERENPNNLEL